MVLLHVSQCTDRKLENLAAIHLKYHCVGPGVQKCQTRKMTLKKPAPESYEDISTWGLWPSDSLIRYGKLWRRWLWKKIPPNVMMMLAFPAHSVAEMLGVLEPRKSPKRQTLLGWGLELVPRSAYSSPGAQNQDSDPCLRRFKWGLAVPSGLPLSEGKCHVARCPSAQCCLQGIESSSLSSAPPTIISQYCLACMPCPGFELLICEQLVSPMRLPPVKAIRSSRDSQTSDSSWEK